MKCILLSAVFDLYVDSKNKHDMSNLKFLHTFTLDDAYFPIKFRNNKAVLNLLFWNKRLCISMCFCRSQRSMEKWY
jgi:hypothetical protein